MESMEREWNKEYEELVKDSLDRGEITLVGDGEEKRASPRFRIKNGAIWVRMDSCFDVLDASTTGICFQSDRSFKESDVIVVTLAKAFKIEAKVMSCEMVETDSAMLETKYITRCRFIDEHSAVRFLVMLKAVDDHEIELVTP